MGKAKIIFRADGSITIGMGHFIRTLALAEILKDDFYCIFATQSPSVYQINEIEKVCHGRIDLPSNDSHFNFFLNLLQGGEIVLMDNYYFTSSYQAEIRNKGCKVVYIDDFNDKHYVCDALINNIPGFGKNTFKRESYTKLYLGIDYALLRKEFMNPEWRILPKKQNVIFISFGGSDSNNLTCKFLEYLKLINPGFSINLIIGDAFQHKTSLADFTNVNIYKNIPAHSVANLMAEAEICIVPASSLLNEVASIGSKALIGYFVNNQIQPYNYFVENQMAVGLGNFLTIDFQIFKEKFELVKISDNIVKNQHNKYKLNQTISLRNIFLSI